MRDLLLYFIEWFIHVILCQIVFFLWETPERRQVINVIKCVQFKQRPDMQRVIIITVKHIGTTLTQHPIPQKFGPCLKYIWTPTLKIFFRSTPALKHTTEFAEGAHSLPILPLLHLHILPVQYHLKQNLRAMFT